jgi:polyisoprenoid-binding protein YceI
VVRFIRTAGRCNVLIGSISRRRCFAAVAIAACVGLFGCQAAGPNRSAASSAGDNQARIDAQARDAFAVYRIDSASSDVRILVYRAGALARLGHNHVISARRLTGRVYLRRGLLKSSFDLTVPVDGLEVDDPEARAEEGEAFSSQPSQSDIRGTRRNLLGKRVLDAAEFPTVTLSGALGSVDPPSVQCTLSFRGRPVQLSVPVELEVRGPTLRVSGSFSLSHEQLGLEPFSVLLGAIKVADQLDLKFRIEARRQQDS